MFWPKSEFRSFDQKDRLAFYFEHLLLMLIIFMLLPDEISYQAQPFPKGWTRFLDFSFLGTPWVYSSLKILLLGFCFPLFLGRYISLFYIYSLSLLTAVFAFQQSQGITNHSGHLPGLILVAKLMAIGYKQFFPDNKLSQKKYWEFQNFFILQLTSAFYLTSAISKMVNTLGGWVGEAPLILSTVIKSNDSRFYDELVAGYWGRMDNVVIWLNQHHWILITIFGFVLLFESLVFLSLINRRLKFIVGLALILMHFSISYFLKINFWPTIFCLGVYFFEIPYWTSIKFEKGARAMLRLSHDEN